MIHKHGLMSIERLKLYYGILLLLILAALGFWIVIGHVTSYTSFGLMPIVTALATLAGSFSGWAFQGLGGEDSEDEEDEEKLEDDQDKPERDKRL